MRTVRTKIYKFSELSEEAQAKAIEHCRHYNVEGIEWYDFIFDSFKEKAKDRGFEVLNIYFSGFASQGDGAMFEGEVCDFMQFTTDINPHVVNLIRNKALDLCCSIFHEGNYYHENSKRVAFDTCILPGQYILGKGSTGNIQTEVNKLKDNINTAYVTICRELYKTLENEYLYLIGDEAVKDSLESNQYEFYQNGERYVAKS